MTFAEMLIDYRAKHRLSQAKLAKKLGVSLGSIYRWESEMSTPQKAVKARVCRILEGGNNEKG